MLIVNMELMPLATLSACSCSGTWSLIIEGAEKLKGFAAELDGLLLRAAGGVCSGQKSPGGLCSLRGTSTIAFR
jgi:hypothetical protein